MRVHVSRTAQTCFYHLRRLRSIRRQLGRDVTARLVSAFVCNKLNVMLKLIGIFSVVSFLLPYAKNI